MFGGMDQLIEKILIHLVNEYPALFGLGAYVLALIAMSTLALSLVLIVSSVWIPLQLASRLFLFVGCKDSLVV